jgi:hypothetical protein
MSGGWSYRIVRHHAPSEGFALREVFCDESGAPRAVTAEPATFGCAADDGAKGVIRALQAALADATKWPVLDEGDIPDDGAAW